MKLKIPLNVATRSIGKNALGLLKSSSSSQILINSRSCSNIRFLDDTNEATLKRGTGGRSSYSGVTAAVFGCTGFLGRSVCNKLGKMGTQLILPYRCDPYDARNLKLVGDLGQVIFYDFHICNEDDLRKIMEYSDVVINLVGRDWPTINFDMKQANVDTAERLARISKEMGVKKFIHMSALNVDRPHEGFINPGGSEFINMKAMSEQVVREHRPDSIIFRPSDIYGQQDRFFRCLMQFWRPTLPNLKSLPNRGKGVWKQPVFVQDVAKGIVKAVYSSDFDGQIIEAVGPKRYEMYELVKWMHRAIDQPQLKIMDYKFDVVSQMKANLFSKSYTNPVGYMSPDRYEREAITDMPLGLPDLRDLGVELTSLENRIIWELKWFHKNNSKFLDMSPSEFSKPAPAPSFDA